ncbi:SDR family oxidoreductase [Frondihabitans australicus]|uniref:3-oxoacyl-[acyl-carrier protein] reductase n=1 Tax=Frondihabitans australicus TaxID=386892 RepID=A0A495IJ06_9MICO|nr:SDR family oxidoreductase [Frondihabitans australicus]RKR75957.1 3-oxoacyl-[acyl-carrier protein] reductase [Frondihabitans australicus]
MTTQTIQQDATAVAIVTGASGELGRAIALRLARDGFAVVAHFSRGEAAAQTLVAEIVAGGGRALAVGGDIADPATSSRLFDAAEQEFGGADVLVSNAGASILGRLADMTDADYDTVMDASARGTFAGLREAATRLRDGGRIVTLSTTSLAVGTPGMGLYMAAKSAVETLTRAAAKELAPRRITVNAVAPGAIASRMFFEGKSPEQIARIADGHPAGRLGEPDDIASAVALLVGQDAGWISGQVIRVNGGVA